MPRTRAWAAPLAVVQPRGTSLVRRLAPRAEQRVAQVVPVVRVVQVVAPVAVAVDSIVRVALPAQAVELPVQVALVHLVQVAASPVAVAVAVVLAPPVRSVVEARRTRLGSRSGRNAPNSRCGKLRHSVA